MGHYESTYAWMLPRRGPSFLLSVPLPRLGRYKVRWSPTRSSLRHEIATPEKKAARESPFWNWCLHC